MIASSLTRLIETVLAEDIGHGDLTTDRTVPPEARCQAALIAKQDGVLSGIDAFKIAFECLHAKMSFWEGMEDGSWFSKGDTIARFEGQTRSVLTGERTAMNFAQHLSGVATLTDQFVKAVKGLGTTICDTRKTTPLLRRLEKRAVVHGNGTNHRSSLSNGVIIKENHIAAAGGIAEAINRVRHGQHLLLKIEVEVRTLDEFKEAMAAGAEIIMLDNMTRENMRIAVEKARGKSVMIEASGNITLRNVRAVAKTGVDIISIGALTHSSPAVDMSLLITNA